ncbi:MAG: hypothetical protein ICCCNLDF_00919 [Planctomycetes bacterium]|nr:hypothetical protein [Planctomycetota bacterium]
MAANWALLVIQFDAPEPARTEFFAAVDLTGWSRIEGMDGCWYGRLGRMNWRQALLNVERMLEIAALTSGVESEIPFVLHTGESAPHFGKVEAAGSVGKTVKPVRRKVMTKRLPAETKRIRKPEHPTKKV